MSEKQRTGSRQSCGSLIGLETLSYVAKTEPDPSTCELDNSQNTLLFLASSLEVIL